MRIVKEASERKNEILDVAERLFATRGYDNTSTNDIINEIGIARGTLYHHFSSKEEILDAMIKRLEEKMIVKAEAISSNREIPLLDRVTMTVMALNLESGVESEIMEQIHKPQNALLHQKMQISMINKIVPIFAKLINEGNEAGVFNCRFVREAAEMIVIYTNVAFDDLVESSPEEQQMKVMGFINNTERMLGAEEGVLIEPLLKLF